MGQPYPEEAANWERWIYSSIANVFQKDFQGLSGVKLYFAGTHRGLPDDVDVWEFRMDGVDIHRPSQGVYVLSTDVNIFIQSLVRPGELAIIRQWMGEVALWLSQGFCIRRIGSSASDDDSILGKLVFGGREKLGGTRSSYLGLVDKALDIEQASVEASYEMHLTRSS